MVRRKTLFILSFLGGLSLAWPAQARVIKSTLPLKYFAIGKEGELDRYLGSTPIKKGGRDVNVPLGDWYVYPVGKYTSEQWKALAGEIARLKVPGLDLSDRWDFSNQTLENFEQLPSLRIIFLNKTKVTDPGLEYVGKFPNLEVLLLPPKISDAGLQHLKALKRLKRVELAGAPVTDKGVSHLRHLTNLQKIDLSDTRITDGTAKVLKGMTAIKEVDVSGTAMTDKGVALLAQLPQLRVLYLPAAVSDETIRKLTQVKTLRSLDVSGSRVTEAGVAVLAEWHGLRELALSGTRIGNSSVTYLERMKDLRTLELSDTAVSGDGFIGSKGFARLETLGVSWGEITEPEIRALGGLPRLKSVVLHGWTLSGESLGRIRAMAKAYKPPKTTVEHLAAVPVQKQRPSPAVPKGILTPQKLEEKQRVGLHRPASQERVRPADAPLSESGRPEIALDAPQGEGMMIEVAAAPSSSSAGRPARRVTGLKRIHQMELSQGPRDIDLSPGASPKISFPSDDPANSLGEIDVNTR